MRMRSVIKDLFLQPKVFFMIMVICLSPLVQTMQAWEPPPPPPPDLSALAAAYAEAQANVTSKGIARAQAYTNMVNASVAVDHWARVVEERVLEVEAADYACYISATFAPYTAIPLILALGTRYWLGGVFDDAVDAFNNALAEYNTAAAAYSAANIEYLDAVQTAAGAYAAYREGVAYYSGPSAP